MDNRLVLAVVLVACMTLEMTAGMTTAMAPSGATTMAPSGATTMGGGATPAVGGGATPAVGGGATPAVGGGATPAVGGGATPAVGGGATPAVGGGATPAVGGGATPAVGGGATPAVGGGATPAVGGGTTPAVGGGATPVVGGGATPAVGGGATPVVGGGATPAVGGGATPAVGGGATPAVGGGATPAVGGGATPAMGGDVTNAPTAAPTTPLMTNTSVQTLTANITRAECGGSRFCAAVPSDCDPAVAGSCFFLSTAVVSGQILSFALRGASSGYIAVGLSADATQGGNDTTYVCAANNGAVEFFTTLLDNGVLIKTSTLAVNTVKGSVDGDVISCTFVAMVPSATSTRAAADSSFFLSLSDGTFTNGTLGAPQSRLLSSAAVNLADPTANATNAASMANATTVAPTTAAATTAIATTSHAVTLQRSLSQATLILLGVLGLVML